MFALAETAKTPVLARRIDYLVKNVGLVRNTSPRSTPPAPPDVRDNRLPRAQQPQMDSQAIDILFLALAVTVRNC